MTSTTTLTMVDGVRIVLPDSLNLITRYVIEEQRDWFEDEVKFLRRLLRTGQRVIDIGANYGVYTLSMARSVGPDGRVWAFEPAFRTAQMLAESASANGFSQVAVERSALSNTGGTGRLSLNKNSEMNALLHDAAPAGASEAVPLATLDECLARYDWHDIAFMKIDAEGEEANILEGGRRFFAELSPLVQYEIKAGTELHMELVSRFAALGYDSYRLVPGLDVLIPFDASSKPDDYLLNLFCCKKGRAEALAAEGHLLTGAAGRLPSAAKQAKYDWRHGIEKLPYGSRLAERWAQTTAGGHCGGVEEALSLYALSVDRTASTEDRLNALEGCLRRLESICDREPLHLRLASLARAARDYGARALAVNALGRLANAILQSKRTDTSEPFLAPCQRFESVPPGDTLDDWVLAAVLEEYERLATFSSFYAGTSALKRLQVIDRLGYQSAEMERRLRLVRTRFGLSGQTG